MKSLKLIFVSAVVFASVACGSKSSVSGTGDSKDYSHDYALTGLTALASDGGSAILIVSAGCVATVEETDGFAYMVEDYNCALQGPDGSSTALLANTKSQITMDANGNVTSMKVLSNVNPSATASSEISTVENVGQVIRITDSKITVIASRLVNGGKINYTYTYTRR